MSLGSGGVFVGAGGVQPRGAIVGPESSAVVSVDVLAAGLPPPGGSAVWQAVRRRVITMNRVEGLIIQLAGLQIP